MADNTPTIQDMEKEPALTIGEIFASKIMIKPYVAAFVGILAQVFQFTVDNGLVDSISLLVTLFAMGYAALVANREKSKLAIEQAKETRSAVYSPATTQRLVNRAARTRETEIDPPPAMP